MRDIEYAAFIGGEGWYHWEYIHAINIKVALLKALDRCKSKERVVRIEENRSH